MRKSKERRGKRRSGRPKTNGAREREREEGTEDTGMYLIYPFKNAPLLSSFNHQGFKKKNNNN